MDLISRPENEHWFYCRWHEGKLIFWSMTKGGWKFGFFGKWLGGWVELSSCQAGLTALILTVSRTRFTADDNPSCDWFGQRGTASSRVAAAPLSCFHTAANSHTNTNRASCIRIGDTLWSDERWYSNLCCHLGSVNYCIFRPSFFCKQNFVEEKNW